jgi:hypothetical protein
MKVPYTETGQHSGGRALRNKVVLLHLTKYGNERGWIPIESHAYPPGLN